MLILFQKLPESNIVTEIPITTMSTVPQRQGSAASSIASSAGHQNSPNPNKNQQVKQNKTVSSGEKPSSNAGSTNAVSEISEWRFF